MDFQPSFFIRGEVMWSLFMAVCGLVTGGMINVLADDLPERAGISRPRCPHCRTPYPFTDWLGIPRWLLRRGKCPSCHKPSHWRYPVIEISTAILWAIVPLVITDPITVALTAFFIAVLLLIIVIDLEHRLILHVVTFPVTVLALLSTFKNPDPNNSPLIALLGAAAGFIIFYLFYLLGTFLFGPGALGFGDVTLAMMMGAMLGLLRIPFALIIGILLGGIVSILLLLLRRSSARTYLPYGQYLAAGGIIVLLWGNQILDWYIGPLGQ